MVSKKILLKSICQCLYILYIKWPRSIWCNLCQRSLIPASPPEAWPSSLVSKQLLTRFIFTLCSTQNLWKPSPALNRYLWRSKNSKTDGEASSQSVPSPRICKWKCSSPDARLNSTTYWHADYIWYHLAQSHQSLRALLRILCYCLAFAEFKEA